MAAGEIIGREEELASIQAFLAEVEQGPTALVLSGEAGIGKTILWEAGVEDARERFGRVLTFRGIEAEASLSFAGLSELLAPVLDEAMPSLVTPRRRALEVALLLVEPGDQPPDAHAIGLAVLDVLSVLAERGPLLVALDDVQWLDPASAGAIQIALRRLREEPIGLFATLRKAPELEARSSSSAPSRGAAGAGLGRPAEPGRGASTARGAARPRADEAGARPRPGGDGGQPVLRARARARACSDRHPARGRPGLADAREPAGTARRPPRPPARRHPRRPAAGSGARTADSRGRRGRLRRTASPSSRRSKRPFAKAWSSSTTRTFASHTRCWPRSATSRRRSGSAAPCIAHLPARSRTSRSGHATWRSRPTGQTPQSPRSSTPPPSRRPPAGRPAAAAELCELAAELTADDPALARQRRLRAATPHRLAGNTDRAVAMLEQLLTEVPSGVERADILFGLAYSWRAAVPRGLELCDEALAEGRATTPDLRGFWPSGASST